MLNAELWTQGLTIMVVAMGIVFSFLVILVISMHIMTKCITFINKIWPEKLPEQKQNLKIKSADESEIALAIALTKLRV